MPDYREYAYTFRVILPDCSDEQVHDLTDKMYEYWVSENRPAVTTPSSNYMRISIAEETDDPRSHLHFALYLARLGLSELGVEPVFIQAHAMSLETVTILEAHKAAIFETNISERVDLTDDLLHEELRRFQ